MSNKLYHVKDAVSPNLYDNDFENATSFNTSNPSVNNNYQYDANGNLAADVVEQMQEIQWNSIGKIKAIIRTSGSVKPDIEYGYRADGQRLYKLVKPKESNGALKQELSWVYTYYVRDLEGNVMATYEKTMESTTTANTYKENYKASAWDLFGSSRLGVLSEKNNLISTREFTKFGTTNSGSWVDRTYTGAATLTTMNAVIHTITRGNKQFELCNHLGNVLVTVQDRKRSVDINADNAADYYLPYLRNVTNYYAFGSAMPGIGGSVKECTVSSSSASLKKYPYFYTFSNDSTSGFTAGSGARTVSNPTHNVLHLESVWTTRPLANKTIYLKNGVNYTLKLNITGFSVVSGYTHAVRVRILLPGSTITNNYTATGIQTINLTSYTTGNVTVEISSQITGSGSYSINPYVDIDNFNLSWDSAYTAYVNNCNVGFSRYKYGYQGSEKDNEIGDDIENTFFRELDSRICRWWGVDPKATAFESPFIMMGNNPIRFNDVLGDSLPILGVSSKSMLDLKKMVSADNQWRLKAVPVNGRSYLNVLNVNLGASDDGTIPAYIVGTDAALDLLNTISIAPTDHIAYEVGENPLVVSSMPGSSKAPPFTPKFFNENVNIDCEFSGLLIAGNASNGLPTSPTDLCQLGYCPAGGDYSWLIARHPNVKFYSNTNFSEELNVEVVMYEQIYATWMKNNSKTFISLSAARKIAEDKATTASNYKGVSGIKIGNRRLVATTIK